MPPSRLKISPLSHLNATLTNRNTIRSWVIRCVSAVSCISLVERRAQLTPRPSRLGPGSNPPSCHAKRRGERKWTTPHTPTASHVAANDVPAVARDRLSWGTRCVPGRPQRAVGRGPRLWTAAASLGAEAPLQRARGHFREGHSGRGPLSRGALPERQVDTIVGPTTVPRSRAGRTRGGTAVRLSARMRTGAIRF